MTDRTNRFVIDLVKITNNVKFKENLIAHYTMGNDVSTEYKYFANDEASNNTVRGMSPGMKYSINSVKVGSNWEWREAVPFKAETEVDSILDAIRSRRQSVADTAVKGFKQTFEVEDGQIVNPNVNVAAKATSGLALEKSAQRVEDSVEEYNRDLFYKYEDLLVACYDLLRSMPNELLIERLHERWVHNFGLVRAIVFEELSAEWRDGTGCYQVDENGALFGGFDGEVRPDDPLLKGSADPFID